MADLLLKELSGLNTPGRYFLSVYLTGSHSVDILESRFKKIRSLLSGSGPEKYERELFEQNAAAVLEYISRNQITSRGLCLFTCHYLDFFKAIPLAVPVADLVRVDAAPFILPLAELEGDYETVAVVVADNTKARIYMISASAAKNEEIIKGNVKNHVRVGGWSQQRYERRRDKELQHYAREIADALVALNQEHKLKHILLVGGKEIIRVVHENLPNHLIAKIAEKTLDLSKEAINEDIMKLFHEEEHKSDQEHWNRIRTEYLQGGLAVIGLQEVFSAASFDRIDNMVVDRTFQPAGRRCRSCSFLSIGAVKSCTRCGSRSLFEVGVINEIAEMLYRSGATIHFTDPIESLTKAGQIAALLRY